MNDLHAPADALASMLGLSPRRVSQLAAEVGARRTAEGWPVAPVVTAHCERLRAAADVADARRAMLAAQTERHRLAAARHARALIPTVQAGEVAAGLWGRALGEINGLFAHLFEDARTHGVDPGDARRLLDPIRASVVGRLVGVRETFAAAFQQLALDSPEKLADAVQAATPEPPSTRKPKATRKPK